MEPFSSSRVMPTVSSFSCSSRVMPTFSSFSRCCIAQASGVVVCCMCDVLQATPRNNRCLSNLCMGYRQRRACSTEKRRRTLRASRGWSRPRTRARRTSTATCPSGGYTRGRAILRCGVHMCLCMQHVPQTKSHSMGSLLAAQRRLLGCGVSIGLKLGWLRKAMQCLWQHKPACDLPVG